MSAPQTDVDQWVTKSRTDAIIDGKTVQPVGKRVPGAVCGWCRCPSGVCVYLGIGAEPAYSEAVSFVLPPKASPAPLGPEDYGVRRPS